MKDPALREALTPDYRMGCKRILIASDFYPALQRRNARLVTSPSELEAFLQPLVEAGVDGFHCSTRRFWQPEFDGSPLNLAGWTKKLSGKPVITVGSVGLDNDFIAGLMQREDVTDLGAVLAGSAPGRPSADDVTAFDSTGLAIQDLAVAIAALERLDDLDDVPRLALD